ncbi:ATP-binding protein [Litchfieldia salsa]|uniref:histidine kinase n=1 Tax=Litchfieldia salsa TaxID=930152 RepID=A0A1H0WKX4_9BACI|nr:ATP-binding protein [Litchfieldia salsa]SDP91273.1 two-component system, sporulation sensor kinase A/two-component system, chemotaxis family, CheB/CheR fusion protein [Litchfieldia salsa]
MNKRKGKNAHIWLILGGLFLVTNQMVSLMANNLYMIKVWSLCFSFLFIGIFILLFLSKKTEQDHNHMILKKIVEKTPFGYVLTSKGKVLYVNNASLAMFGASKKEQILRHHLSEFLGLGLREFHRWKQVNIEETIETKILKVDGNKLDVELISMTIDEKHQFFVMRDISESRKSNEIIQQSEKLSVVGELAAGIAHEIRNPLTSLKGFLQLIEHGTTDENARKSYSKVMLAEIERINKIVGELLFLSKPQKVELAQCNLMNLLESVIFLLNTQAILYNIQIQLLGHDRGRNMVIYCDETKIKQVFINLLKNSIESMKVGGVIQIIVNTNDDNSVHIQVVDQGYGIPKEKLEYIGKAFYSSKEGGTGLGLMVSRRIIHDHEGELTIDSLENQGTTVSVSLPVAR